MNLTVENLCFQYENQKELTLNKMTFEMAFGTSLCIAGPNGSGKSTLLKLISGFLKPLSGDVFWKNEAFTFQKITEWPTDVLTSQVAFIPAAVQTNFPISVFDFVLQGLFPLQKKSLLAGLQAYSKAERLQTEQVLESIGIAGLKNRLLSEISTGECQLTLIARALVRNPKVLIFDESIANLDFFYLSKIFEIIHHLKVSGISIIMVSHDLNLATEFCDNILWIKNGTCLGIGKTGTLLTKEWIERVYHKDAHTSDLRIQVSDSPFSGRPKIFWV